MMHFIAIGALGVVGLAFCGSVLVVFTMHGLAAAFTIPRFGFFTVVSLFSSSNCTKVWGFMYTCLGTGRFFRGDIVQ